MILKNNKKIMWKYVYKKEELKTSIHHRKNNILCPNLVSSAALEAARDVETRILSGNEFLLMAWKLMIIMLLTVLAVTALAG